VILGGALYQLTGPKDACLRRCRPRAFLGEHWRSGRVGALRMGAEHGGVCVACCWGLMAALFALGVMSTSWMALVAALIAAERLLPWKTIAGRGVAVVLALLALGVAPRRGARLHGARLAPGRGDHGFDADALSQKEWWMTVLDRATTVSCHALQLTTIPRTSPAFCGW
jgi:hypothetical protein